MTVVRPRRRAAEAEPPHEQAARLATLVGECAASGIARRAVLLRLSRLPEALSKPHHLRLAQAALDPLAGADRARFFRLPNNDVAAIWRGESTAALREALDAVALLFADAGESLPDPAALAVTLSLPADAAVLLQAVEAALHPPACVAPRPGPAAEPLDPAALATLETLLAQADMSRFVRRRRICAWTHDGFRLRWEKRTLSVAELAATVAPDRAVTAERWLFRRLTRTLDRRMLALLAAPQELRDAGPFSLDLNVASILSPGFLRFDAALPGSLRGQVVLNLLPADAMADPAAFQFARDFARARGFRLLLRGLTPVLLPAFPLRRIGLDLAELRWSPALAAAAPPPLPDPARMVLTRADTAEALAWGLAQGIALFEGPAVAAARDRDARRTPSPILALGEAGGGA